MSDNLILQVEILDGDEVVETLELSDDKIKVGKLSSSQLHLDDPKVSRIHAVLESQGDGTYLVIDLGSASGTYVNGQKVSKQAVGDGDEVRFGGTTVRLGIIDPAERAAAQAAAASQATTDGPVPEGHIRLEDGSVVEPYTLEGYYDDAGNYIPGYYDEEGAYHYGYGYYDDDGAWQVAHGFYDPEGEWIPTGEPEGPQRSDTEVYTENFFRTEETGTILEVAYLWSDRVVDVQSLKTPRTLVIGGNEENDYVLEDPVFSNPQFPLVVYNEGQGYRLNFAAQMSGTIQRDGQQMSLDEAIEQGFATQSHDVPNAYTIPLARGMSVRLDFGRNTFLIHFSRLPALAGGALAFDRAAMTFLAISLVLHLAFMMLVFMLPAGYGGLNLHDFAAHDRFVELASPPEEEEEEEEEIPEWMDEQSDDAADAPVPDDDVEIDETEEVTDQDLQEARDRAVAEQHGAIAALDNMVMPTDIGQEAFGALQALDSDSDAVGALGGLEMAAGARHGTGGEAGVGRVATGRPGGTGTAPVSADLGDHQALEPELVLEAPVTQGALDREIIQRVVRQHRREIRNCYERQLQRNPDLQGRIVMQWVISGTGAVVSARVEETTMNNSEVEQCMAQRIRRWSFPEPDGGGIVRVNYPFNFSS